MRKIKTALYLSPKQIAVLKKISKRLDIPMSQIIRQGVDLAIEKLK
jgi:hypothetical protein